ncbi:MAG: MiaB/RimO family radical SAM methylthiotransferase [Gemmatimonadota bacterium]|nr:MiaB/RimO family radical SAM methylthiotransferase [Gemmatimonadota bacterium]
MKVYLATFGCRANHYDSESVRAMLGAAGHEVVATPELADTAVFNSCAVTADAVADLRQHLRRAARRNSALSTVVMGCAPAAHARELRALPTVRHLVEGADLDALADSLGIEPSYAAARATAQTGTRALLRIQDGCDEHCTFCATTLARGANRSRGAQELVEEASRLAGAHAEIVLTGIHIGSYGADTGSSLGALAATLVRALPATRFRLSSLEATEVDDRLRELFGDPCALAPHLHAPLQSGSDRVLKRMGRHWYTARSYAESIERIIAAHPVFGLGADVIAGFPGESEEDHAATLSLIDQLPFSYLHVFTFSERPGTAAPRLGDLVPGDVAARRARELRALGSRKAAAYAIGRAGGEADVIVIGDAGKREGLSEDFLSPRLAEPAIARGTRLPCRLSLDGDMLVAHAFRGSFQPWKTTRPPRYRRPSTSRRTAAR